MGTVAAVLAGLLSGAAAANAGACDAKRAQSLVGRSYSPRLEQETLALSGASTAAIFGQGLAGTADYRTDRVDLWLDRKGNVVGIFLRVTSPHPRPFSQREKGGAAAPHPGPLPAKRGEGERPLIPDPSPRG